MTTDTYQAKVKSNTWLAHFLQKPANLISRNRIWGH